MARTTPPDRRNTIIAAAQAEFAIKGFAAARMDDIAARVGISKAALYLQFADKEALFRAMMEQAVADTLPVILPTQFEGHSAAALLRTFIAIALREITQPDVAFIPRIIIGESGNFPELARLYREQLVDKVMASLIALIRHGIVQGELNAVDPVHAARTIAGSVIIGLLWQTVLEPAGAEPIDIAATAQAHADIILHGLCREYKEPQE